MRAAKWFRRLSADALEDGFRRDRGEGKGSAKGMSASDLKQLTRFQCQRRRVQTYVEREDQGKQGMQALMSLVKEIAKQKRQVEDVQGGLLVEVKVNKETT